MYNESSKKKFLLMSNYGLPCLYCGSDTSFESSASLKQHLLSEHPNIIHGAGRYNNTENQQRESTPPHSEVLRRNKGFSSRESFSKCTTVHGNPVKKRPVRSQAEIRSPAREVTVRNINTLTDLLNERDSAIEKLQCENDSLRDDMRALRDSQYQLKARWRREAESALHDLKFKNEQLTTQISTYKKQLQTTDREKDNIRSSNEKLAKEHLNLKAQMAADQMQCQSGELTRLTLEMESVQRENGSLKNMVGKKNDTIQRQQNTIDQMNQELADTRKWCDKLNEENGTLKESMAFAQSNNNIQMERKSEELLRGVKENDGLVEQIEGYKETVKKLDLQSKQLKEDKQKLVEHLHSADTALQSLASRVNSTASVQSAISPQLLKASGRASYQDNETVEAIFKSKELSSDASELNRVRGELQRSNVALIEEKSLVIQLKKRLQEIEEYLASQEENSHEDENVYKELRFLRAKHQKCENSEKERKRLRQQKKLAVRRYGQLQREYNMLNVIYQSSVKALEHFNEINGNHLAEIKDTQRQLGEVRQQLTEKTLSLEQSSYENKDLVEKLNTAEKEVEKAKAQCANLETKFQSFSSLKNLIVETNTNLKEEKEGREKKKVEQLVKSNQEYQARVDELQQALFSLEAQHKELEQASSNEDALTEAQQIIDNLIVEKDILTSRVLILEGIREEMRILRSENERQRKEITRLKNQPSKQNIAVEPLFSNEPTIVQTNVERMQSRGKDYIHNGLFDKEPSCHHELDALQDNEAQEFFESIRNIDDLDEEDKERLRSQLMSKDFEKFLGASNEIAIDLHGCNHHSSSVETLSTACSEHAINYIQGRDEGTNEDTSFGSEHADSTPKLSHNRLLKSSISSSLVNSTVDGGNSSSTQTTKLSRSKSVSFSEHMVQVMGDASETTEDFSMHKGFFQQALENAHPDLISPDLEYDETAAESHNETSEGIPSPLRTPQHETTETSSPAQVIRPSLREKVLELMNNKILSPSDKSGDDESDEASSSLFEVPRQTRLIHQVLKQFKNAQHQPCRHPEQFIAGSLLSKKEAAADNPNSPDARPQYSENSSPSQDLSDDLLLDQSTNMEHHYNHASPANYERTPSSDLHRSTSTVTSDRALASNHEPSIEGQGSSHEKPLDMHNSRTLNSESPQLQSSRSVHHQQANKDAQFTIESPTAQPNGGFNEQDAINVLKTFIDKTSIAKPMTTDNSQPTIRITCDRVPYANESLHMHSTFTGMESTQDFVRDRPSCMNKPVTMNFSDGSFCDVRLKQSDEGSNRK